MRMTATAGQVLLSLLVLCLCLAGGPARAGSGAHPDEGPRNDAGDVLRLAGSGSSLEYSREISRQFATAYPQTVINVYPGLGSGGAIRALMDGALEAAISRRPLKPAERASGLIALPLMETPFGFFTSRTAPVSISHEEVWRLYDRLGQPNQAFGGQLVRVILRPHADSDRRLAVEAFPRLDEAMHVADRFPGVPTARTDPENADLAESLSNSLTSGTLLQMMSEGRALAPVSIDGAAPSVDAMMSGEYPYKATLYLVYAAPVTPVVKRFVDFVVSAEAIETTRRLGAVIVQ